MRKTKDGKSLWQSSLQFLSPPQRPHNVRCSSHNQAFWNLWKLCFIIISRYYFKIAKLDTGPYVLLSMEVLKLSPSNQIWPSGTRHVTVYCFGYCYPPPHRKSGSRQTFLPSPQHKSGSRQTILPCPQHKLGSLEALLANIVLGPYRVLCS